MRPYPTELELEKKYDLINEWKAYREKLLKITYNEINEKKSKSKKYFFQ